MKAFYKPKNGGGVKIIVFLFVFCLVGAGVFVFAPVPTCNADVTGWKTAGTCASVDRDSKNAWSDPTNAEGACDDSRAVCYLPSAQDYTDWLRATNFGFTTDDIPSGATINGIEVKIERYANLTNTANDSALYLRDTNGQTGDNKASATLWPSSEAEATYGASDDDWNAGLSDSDIRDSSFGVDISVFNDSGFAIRSAYIDCFSIRVHYTPSNAAPTITSASITDMDDTDNIYAQTLYSGSSICSDADGYADIDYCEFRLKQDTTTRAIFRYDEDTDTFSTESGSTEWDLDGTSSAVESGTDITITWKFTPQWDAVEEDDLEIELYVVDAASAEDTDTAQSDYVDVITDLVTTFSIDDDRGDISQSITASGTVTYSGSSVSPPGDEFTSVSVFDSACNEIGCAEGTDSSIVSGAWSVTFNAPDTVGTDTYNLFINMADADYSDGEETANTDTFITDRIEVTSVAFDDSRIDISGSAEVRYALQYDYDDVAFDDSKGSVTDSTGWVSPTGFNDPASGWGNEANAYDGDTGSYAGEVSIAANSWGDWLELTHSAVSCNSIQYNAYYNVALINQINVDVHYDGEAADTWHDVYEGSSAPHNTWVTKIFPDGTQTIDKARIKYYNDYGSQVSNVPLYEFDFGNSFSWDSGNNWWDKAITGSASVTSTNYDETDISFTDSEYGITAIEDDDGLDIITDRINFKTAELETTDDHINSDATGEWYAELLYEYDDEEVKDGTVALNTDSMTWDSGPDDRWEYTNAPGSVVDVTRNIASVSGNNHGITALNSNVTDKSAIIEFDEVVFKTGNLETTDSRINYDATGEWYCKLMLDNNDADIISGTITLNTGTMTYDTGADARWEYTNAPGTVSSVSRNIASVSGLTGGITKINSTVTSDSEDIIFDKVQVQSYTVADSRVNVDDSVNIDTLLYYDYDNSEVTDGTVTINAVSASYQGSGTWRITQSKSSVQAATYDTVAASGNTHGITAIDQNSQDTTVIWDRIRIDSIGVVDGRIDIDTQGTFYATASLEYDDHPLGSGDSLTLGGQTFTWSDSNSRFEYSDTKSSVQAVTIDTFTSGSEATYGITAGNINSQTGTVVWDRIEVFSVAFDDSRIDISGSAEVRYALQYDYQDESFTDSEGSVNISGSAASYDSGNGWWERTFAQSSSVTSTNYDETDISFTDSTYGITAIEDVAGADIVTDRINFKTATLETTDAHINSDATGEWYAELLYEYDNTEVEDGSVALNTGSMTWDGTDGRWEYTNTPGSVVDVTRNIASVSGNTYGITALNSAVTSDSETIEFDEVVFKTGTLETTDGRINYDATGEWYCELMLDNNDSDITSGTITLNTGTMTYDAGDARWEYTNAPGTVGSVSRNIASASGLTRGITKINSAVTGDSEAIIFDRINFKTATLETTDAHINSDATGEWYAELKYEYDNTEVNDGSVTLNTGSMTWDGTDGRWEYTNSKGSVGAEARNIASVSGNTYGITALNSTVADDSETIIFDQIEVVSVAFDDSRIDISGSAEVRYVLRYDYDDTAFDNTKGTVTGFTWDSGNSWWDKAITGSASVTSTNYDETDISFTDSTYGITAIEDDAGADIITDRIKILTLSAVDDTIPSQTEGTWYATAELEYDNHSLGSGDSFTLSAYDFSWDAGDSRFEATDTKDTAQTVTIDAYDSGTEVTYGITAGNINSLSQSIEWQAAGGGGGLSPSAYNPPVPPEKGFSISINDDAEYTNDPTVILNLDGGPEAEKMAISNFSDFRGAGQEPYQTEKEWNLSEGDGVKTVYTKFYTQYGQPSEVVSDTIILDTQAPEIEITKIKDYYRPDENIILSGLTEANAELTLHWAEKYGLASSDDSGYWIVNLGKLPVGQYPLSITPEDLAGNVGESLTISLIIEAELVPEIPEIIPEKPEEEIPEEEIPEEIITVPEQAPLPMQAKWDLLSYLKLGLPFEKFVLAPLPKKIEVLTEKFPELEKTLSEVGITKMTELKKMKGVKLTLPGLTERVGLPVIKVEPGKFALPQGIPLAKMSPGIKEKIPPEIVFAKTGGELIDFNIVLTLSEKGEPQQKITTISGKPLQLTVKPEKPVKSIKGYVVFKSKKPESSSFQFPLNSLTASLIFTNPVFAYPQEKPVEVEERLVLIEFEYTDPDGDGIYTAEIQAPVVEGEYEIITVMDYEDPELGKKEIRLITVVDPEGYVYEKVGDKETRIPGAIISLYWLNPEIKQYELWPAKEYQQENPTITDTTGKYSFLVPEGNYYLKVEAPGYLVYDGKPFQVTESSGIHINIELKTKYWFLKVVDWKTILLLAVILLLLYNFYRDRIRERRLRKTKTYAKTNSK